MMTQSLRLGGGFFVVWNNSAASRDVSFFWVAVVQKNLVKTAGLFTDFI